VSSLYLQDANGPAAESILTFSDSVMLLILPIALGVLLFMLRSLASTLSHRLLLEHQALEFTWTLLPSLCLLILAAPSLSLLYLLDEVGSPSCTSLVQGHQWYWVYESSDIASSRFDSYMVSSPLRLLGADTALCVSPRLVLRLLVTSADVLHSFALPSWGLKADAVPGRLNMLSTYLERSGLYYGQCSEICGSNHSFIPVMAEVLS